MTKTAKTVTNNSKLSPIYFVSNMRHQHRCSRNKCSLVVTVAKLLALTAYNEKSVRKNSERFKELEGLKMKYF